MERRKIYVSVEEKANHRTHPFANSRRMVCAFMSYGKITLILV
jgi:hypothetical protein